MWNSKGPSPRSPVFFDTNYKLKRSRRKYLFLPDHKYRYGWQYGNLSVLNAPFDHYNSTLHCNKLRLVSNKSNSSHNLLCLLDSIHFTCTFRSKNSVFLLTPLVHHPRGRSLTSIPRLFRRKLSQDQTVDLTLTKSRVSTLQATQAHLLVHPASQSTLPRLRMPLL